MPEAAELDNSPAPVAIEGSAAAAILLMLLDESEAATILKQLGPEEVRQLAKAMFDTANASEQQIGQALDRFVTRSRDVSALAIGADYLRITGPFFGLFGLGYALYCAGQGTGRMEWPVAGAIVRAVIAIGGGLLGREIDRGDLRCR